MQHVRLHEIKAKHKDKGVKHSNVLKFRAVIDLADQLPEQDPKHGVPFKQLPIGYPFVVLAKSDKVPSNEVFLKSGKTTGLRIRTKHPAAFDAYGTKERFNKDKMVIPMSMDIKLSTSVITPQPAKEGTKTEANKGKKDKKGKKEKAEAKGSIQAGGVSAHGTGSVPPA